MVKVKLESLVEYFEGDFKKILIDSVLKINPQSNLNSNELYKSFKESISQRFGIWMKIPDRYVEPDIDHYI